VSPAGPRTRTKPKRSTPATVATVIGGAGVLVRPGTPASLVLPPPADKAGLTAQPIGFAVSPPADGPSKRPSRYVWLDRVAEHIQHRRLPPSVLITAYRLAGHLGRATDEVWPSQEFLASETGQSVPTVRRHLAELEGLSLIFTRQRGLRRPNLIQIRFDGECGHGVHQATSSDRSPVSARTDRQRAVRTAHQRAVPKEPPQGNSTHRTLNPPVSPPGDDVARSGVLPLVESGSGRSIQEIEALYRQWLGLGEERP
jgi:DNA-binding transcriptional ArsR family regulator